MANSARENPKDVNSELREAIGQYGRSGAAIDLKTVHYFLSKNLYLLASDFVGSSNQPGMNQAREQSVSIKMARNHLGRDVMMAFTDTEAMIAQCGEEARYLTIDANTLLNMTVAQDYPGLVVNPAGPSIYVERADILRIQQQEQRPSTFTPSPVDPEQLRNDELLAAAQALMRSPGEQEHVLFQEELWRSTLLLSMQLAGAGSMQVVGITTAAGVNGFPVFTDLAAVRALGRPMQVLPFDFDTVLAMAVQYPAELFVINPAGPSALELDMNQMKLLYRIRRETGDQGSTLPS